MDPALVQTSVGLLAAVAGGRVGSVLTVAQVDLGLDAPPETGGPLPITASRMGHLWDALGSVYDALGFADAADGDEVFRQLVLARIIEPTSKLDSLRVLTEAGIAPVSYRTLKRRLPAYAAEAWRERLAALCAHHVGLGPATLLLYDVTTLYFETDTTGWSIKKFVKTVRRYRTIQIQAGEHVITAADPLPDNVHQTLEAIKTRAATH